jgi:hypothetical protein
MGCRVHVVSKQREYGVTEAFNYAYDKFSELLEELGCTLSSDTLYYSSFIEAPVSEYKRAIKILERIIDTDSNELKDEIDLSELKSDDFDPDTIDLQVIVTYIKELGYYNDPYRLLMVMIDFYNERDMNSNYIQFEAW